MEQEKDLHASVPSALLAEAERFAAAQHVSMDEFMRAAVKRYVDERGWQELYAYGEEQACKLGIKEEDVDRIIREFREEDRAGKYYDSGCQ